MSYQWVKTNVMVKRLADGANIPNDSGNRDWMAFQSWVAGGGVTEAAPTPPSQDERASIHIDGTDRLQFEVAFDMENRMRAREGLPPVTRVQYRTALINRWKALNA